MSNFGIENLLIITSVLASVGNIAGKAYEDGKLTATDLPDAVMRGAVLIPKLIEIEWNQLIPEAKDLDEGEQAQLLAHFKKEFDIPQDSLELLIEDVIEDIRLGALLVNRMVKRFRREPVEIPAVIAHS